ncbi:hypothetical protein EXE30_06665 [Acinetobacter halotolerans]|uniref:Uncharacterized protein n=1 Tax=Acinetobacter halotolerans TaxID=1752076 RepID=A0A4Q6XJ31_9GAMM|nr:hypothetical protein [Acinetobacter halotolerans]RZF53652.1 hypothetical protein EXE30_06665 [Acinetobacter halotolerans]
MSNLNFTESELVEAIKKRQLEKLEQYGHLANGTSKDYQFGEFSAVPLWWLNEFDANKRRRMAHKLESKGLLKSFRVCGSKSKYSLLTFAVVGLSDEPKADTEG